MVQSAVVEEFTHKLRARIERLHMGNGMDSTTDIGPLINTAAVDKVSSWLYDSSLP